MQMTPAKMVLGLVLAGLSLFVCPTHAAAINTAAKTVSKVTPIQRVLALMTDLKKKAIATNAKERAVFEEYDRWVKAQRISLDFQVDEGKKAIETYDVALTTLANDITNLNENLGKSNEKIEGWKAEKLRDQGTRETEHTEFVMSQMSYVSSIDAVKRAIESVEKGNIDTAALSLIQKSVPDAGVSNVITQFLQHAKVSPSTYAYRGQSANVVALLRDLRTKFKRELRSLESFETGKAQSYLRIQQSLTDSIKYESKAVIKFNEKIGLKEEAKGKAEGAKTEEQLELSKNEQLLLEVNAAYSSKSETYEANQQKRQAEFEAIQKAIDIMSRATVKKAYEKTGLMQQTQAGAFSLLQKTRTTARAVAKHETVHSHKKHSAMKSANYTGVPSEKHFDRVIPMMEELLRRLQEEAIQEQSSKEDCDDKLGRSESAREGATIAIAEIQARIDEASSKIAEESAKHASLNKQVAELAQSMAEAFTLRTEEKETNTATVDEATAAADAVKSAIDILNEFYSPTGFIQKGESGHAQQEAQHQVPEMAAYTGSSDSVAILSVLEIIQSDFLTLKATTSAAETAAETQYDSWKSGADSDKEQKETDAAKAEQDKVTAETAKSEDETLLESKNKELTALNEVYEELKASCINTGLSLGERIAARQREIQSLRAALNVLDMKR